MRSDVPTYARLLTDFAAETGVPALLNTSLNQKAEPIVCSLTDALRTFLSGPLDAFALGDHLDHHGRAGPGGTAGHHRGIRVTSGELLASRFGSRNR